MKFFYFFELGLKSGPGSCRYHYSWYSLCTFPNRTFSCWYRYALSPKNNFSLILSNMIIQHQERHLHASLSTDSSICLNPEEKQLYNIEFLHSLTVTGMSPRELKLKIGAAVMLSRNLDNGTRLRIRAVYDRV